MDQECERSREAAPECSLGWSRNGGTLGTNCTESSLERAAGTAAQTLHRIFAHAVCSTKEPGAFDPTPRQGWPLGFANSGPAQQPQPARNRKLSPVAASRTFERIA